MDIFEDFVVHKEGHVLFAEGDPSQFLYVVKTGKIGIFKEKNRRLLPISILGAKDFVGELSLFNAESKRTASAIVVDCAELGVIRKSDVSHVLRDCSTWVSQLMMDLSERLRTTTILLREHNILDDMSENAFHFKPETLSKYWVFIQDYKKRRGPIWSRE